MVALNANGSDPTSKILISLSTESVRISNDWLSLSQSKRRNCQMDKLIKYRNIVQGLIEQNRKYNMSFSTRITIDPQICHGKPCIRGLRYPVENILELLSSGMKILSRAKE